MGRRLDSGRWTRAVGRHPQATLQLECPCYLPPSAANHPPNCMSGTSGELELEFKLVASDGWLQNAAIAAIVPIAALNQNLSPTKTRHWHVTSTMHVSPMTPQGALFKSSAFHFISCASLGAGQLTVNHNALAILVKAPNLSVD